MRAHIKKGKRRGKWVHPKHTLQLIKLKIPSAIVTTVGGIEEDIMKANGEVFSIGYFGSDDVELHEQGINRVGNLLIKNESYINFEDYINPILDKLYI